MPTKKTLCILLALLGGSCRSSAPPPNIIDEGNPLPDLVIKRIGFRILTTGPRLVPQRVEVLVVPYEFRVQVDNVGSSAFDKPFYVSFTTNVPDYQNYIYSRQELLNEGKTLILPRQSYTFVVSTEIEIPRGTSGSIPVRFYINTEGNLNKLGFQVSRVEERNYKNNVFELSMRLQARR